ncbi:MAG: hypothetical protein M3401_06795 [Actinomycetota bacterium]|nr:hypothetical protein [Actinomycetota bacterium]
MNDPLDSIRKLVGAVAGAGVVLYVIGVSVLWQRLARADVQAQDVITAIPREQLAVAGAREALVSLIAGTVFGLLCYATYRVYDGSRRAAASNGVLGRGARWMRQRPAVVVTLAVAGSCLPVGPFSADGLFFLVMFLALVFLGTRSVHRSLIAEPQEHRGSRLPWLRVLAVLSAAVLLVSILRQREFPDPFSCASIAVGDNHEYTGLYLGLTSDVIILGRGRSAAVPPCSSDSITKSTTAIPPGTTLVVPRSELEQVRLTDGPQPPAPTRSLLGEIGIPLQCVSPICQWDGDRRSILQLILPNE